MKKHKRSAVQQHRLFLVIPYVVLGSSTKFISKHTGLTVAQVRHVKRYLRKILK